MHKRAAKTPSEGAMIKNVWSPREGEPSVMLSVRLSINKYNKKKAEHKRI